MGNWELEWTSQCHIISLWGQRWIRFCIDVLWRVRFRLRKFVPAPLHLYGSIGYHALEPELHTHVCDDMIQLQCNSTLHSTCLDCNNNFTAGTFTDFISHIWITVFSHAASVFQRLTTRSFGHAQRLPNTKRWTSTSWPTWQPPGLLLP